MSALLLRAGWAAALASPTSTPHYPQTNEPAFPIILEQRQQYLAANFSSVPGLAGQPQPMLDPPALIPFNSQQDSRDLGYFGSFSRYLRTWLQLQDCAAYPWPNTTWSPGYMGGYSTTPPPPPTWPSSARRTTWGR